MDIVSFINRWRGDDQSERQSAQPYFLDLCALLNVPAPAGSDAYCFEKAVRTASGTPGWADVWKRNHFGWEFKRKGANLDRAYAQLKHYADDLENPPLLIVSDIERILIKTNFTNTPTRTIELTLDDLRDHRNRQTLIDCFTNPDALRPGTSIDEVNEAAARELGGIAINLRDRGVDPHRAAHYAVELLFCFFAEDVGLLPHGLFTRVLEYGTRHPENFAPQFEQLLRAMQTGGTFNLEDVDWFNGGLFNQIVVEPLTGPELARLHQIATLDWSQVEPAIFGTLFERSLDPARRSQLGAHYTGAADIDRVVDPVVMAPLRREWAAIREQAEAQKGGKRTTRRGKPGDFQRTIQTFLQRLRSVTILDPACGSGNFLYIALRKLMDLEEEVITYAAETGLMPFAVPEINPAQVMGLEISEYAVEITQAVI
jgi:hypothetical protein